MRPNGTWTGLLSRAASSAGEDSALVRAGQKYTMLRKVAGYGVILPLLVCVLVITAVLLAFTVLVARLLSACIGCLEKLSTGFWYGRTKI